MARPAPTPESLRLGERLSALRAEHDLTQQKAAAALQVAESTYQSWEAGEVTAIRKSNRERLAELFGGQPSDYLVSAPEGGPLEARVAALEAALGELITLDEAPGLPALPGELARRLEAARRTLEDHERRRSPPAGGPHVKAG
jgi:transcriptional regulator with XRE-family HTH domain